MAETAHRLFSVLARHDGRQHARMVTEPNYEAAAIAYLEDFHAPAPASDVILVVRDVESGHERCFRIDLESGRTHEM